MLPSWNFAGLVLLCPVWLCFCSAGRYTPFINLQRTCFCVCCVWSCFASAGRYTPPSPLPIELQRTCSFLCPICSCFASCDSCSNVLCRTKKIVNMLPKEHHRQNRQKESQQIIGGGSQTGAQREREKERSAFSHPLYPPYQEPGGRSQPTVPRG
jgi:hypothetical protein